MEDAAIDATWEKLLGDLMAADQRRAELEAKVNAELPSLRRLLALIYALTQ